MSSKNNFSTLTEEQKKAWFEKRGIMFTNKRKESRMKNEDELLAQQSSRYRDEEDALINEMIRSIGGDMMLLQIRMKVLMRKIDLLITS